MLAARIWIDEKALEGREPLVEISAELEVDHLLRARVPPAQSVERVARRRRVNLFEMTDYVPVVVLDGPLRRAMAQPVRAGQRETKVQKGWLLGIEIAPACA